MGRQGSKIPCELCVHTTHFSCFALCCRWTDRQDLHLLFFLHQFFVTLQGFKLFCSLKTGNKVLSFYVGEALKISLSGCKTQAVDSEIFHIYGAGFNTLGRG